MSAATRLRGVETPVEVFDGAQFHPHAHRRGLDITRPNLGDRTIELLDESERVADGSPRCHRNRIAIIAEKMTKKPSWSAAAATWRRRPALAKFTPDSDEVMILWAAGAR